MKPALYGLLGRRLGHSWSRAFFEKFWAERSICAEYRNFEITEITALPELLRELPELRGFNVTVPYKQEIIPYLDELWSGIDRCRAVNTVRIDRSAGAVHLVSTNTDVIGFRQALEPLLKPGMRRALVLGTGGASQAVLYVLQELDIEATVVSRTPGPGRFAYDQLTPDIVADHLLIVNTTPLGMWPDTDSAPDIPYSAVGPRHLCFDLVYNPETTLFMARCEARGAAVSNGLRMLHLQAEASWRFWTERN